MINEIHIKVMGFEWCRKHLLLDAIDDKTNERIRIKISVADLDFLRGKFKD